jgi:hypothetical protein
MLSVRAFFGSIPFSCASGDLLSRSLPVREPRLSGVARRVAATPDATRQGSVPRRRRSEPCRLRCLVGIPMGRQGRDRAAARSERYASALARPWGRPFVTGTSARPDTRQ